MKQDDAFTRILMIEPFYEAEDRLFEPFWYFMYRFQSLQRHWELSKEFFGAHLDALRATKGDGSAEFDVAFSETAGVDIDYIPEYIRLSTISFSLSLVENLLGHLAEEIARDSGASVDLDTRPLPYINKYILWFTRGCGIDIDIDKQLWRRLDAIREMRNRFIHRIDRDVPEQVRKAMGEMVSGISDEQHSTTDVFVDACLQSLAELVKSIERSYIRYYDSISG